AHSGTSPVSGAPLCVSCHKLADPTVPTTGTGTCLSCHVGASGLAGGPTGTTFPNIAGAHAKHLGLKTTLTCDSCHAGSGAGSDRHYANAKSATSGPASVSIAAAFNAQNGGSATFSSSAMTCGAVSCHGGQTTPNWRAGSIASDTQCRVCHTINDGTGVAQFNDALGRHTWGTHKTAGTADCTICHDMSTSNAALGAVNHFAELDTTAVGSTNKLPSGTIVFKNTATYPISGNTTYSVSAPRSEGDGGCALACHGVIHDPAVNHWAAPKGSGVAHPMPFYTTGTSTAGNHHQTVTQAQFTSDCATCHDLSGPSTKSGPACSVCHTLASPVGAGAGAGTCLSCHVGASFTTLGPGGTAWPSLKGSHAKHLSLPTFTRPSPGLPAELASSPYPACAACHQGSVPGDSAQTHYANANKRATTPVTGGPGSVAIASTFNAKSGPASITSSASAFTCSNVSCHGGQTTPGWQTGTLTVNATTYCTACHVARSTATQYNDATGRHVNPSNHRQTCDYCHDMTQAKSGAQNHFKYLDTPAVSGVGGTPADQYPSDTIKFGGGAQPATGALTYTVTPSTQGRGSCALSCHGKTHSNLTWN
ncbi:MAG: CxxxxCH/CxxCH domain-containing protein, partial [Firmicutes bacterium]|nr:CxxxxCH/CxxCH domain-containing protein [Bacillota bacterium]